MKINQGEVKEIHEKLIEKFGGRKGIRENSLLESALFRPFSSFHGEEFYSGIEKKSCVLLESLVKNHPFIDGNKRIGYTVFRLFLLANSLDIAASEEEKYHLVISIASGQASQDDIYKWLRTYLVKVG